jgi:D-glycero-alpha-D-manno-heptose 1-phosphate guanylyltransferase
MILAGGLGTRLREVVNDVPKPMAEISGKPFIDYQIKFIRKYFPQKTIHLLTHYKTEIIESYYQDDNSINIIKENELLGTGGSVNNAICKLNLNAKDKLLLFNGDTFLDFNIIDFIQKSNLFHSILSVFQNNCDRFGTLEIVDNYIINFKEKKIGSKNQYINGGCYFFHNLELFFNIKEEKFSLEEKIMDYIRTDKVKSYKYNGIFIDIGIPVDYERMQHYIAMKQDVK